VSAWLPLSGGVPGRLSVPEGGGEAGAMGPPAPGAVGPPEPNWRAVGTLAAAGGTV
jgi:hypothetical protein